MSVEPYSAGIVKTNPFREKRRIVGEIVAVLDLKVSNRGMKLIHPISRALPKSEIHEMCVTDEESAGPGSTVNRVAYIGFFEVKDGGVAVVGDKVSVGGKLIGTITGFDESHAPNHINVVIKSTEIKTGYELKVNVGEDVVIE